MTTTMAKSAIVTKDEDTAAKCSQLKMKKMKTKTKGKAQLQDDSIMGTNNSSIVSKRSVERLYYADEPHFFRYFVKKPQRRSPLINRGYHLRMKAIDQVVHRFLTEKSSKQKIVINLGCGYDPLPWQCLSRYPDACQGVKFIDIDYRELMLKKCHTVQNTPELNQMLTNLEITKDGDLLLQSGQYLQLGCDLRELTKLHQALASAVDIENCQVLFTAEVSITYMSVEAADSVIKWASTLPEARFCLLEQLLPDGMSHPFAQTMMAHFEKLNTPLRPVKQYPTTEDQERRFRGLGWKYVSATNLWELWTSPDFMTSAERAALDKIEAFDEWEEFALFAHHYVLLVADTVANLGQIEYKLEHNHLSHQDKCTSLALHAAFAEYPKGQGFRRFAQPLSITGPSRSEDGIGNFAGMGLNHRLDTCVVYGTEQTKSIPSNPYGQTFSSDAYPSSRMCHTITDLGGTGALLVGGRASPDNALADCWLYHKWLNIWERVDDLPKARYRHSAVSLGNGSVLVATGRYNSQTILDEYVIWDRRLGWVQCTIKSLDRPLPAYGATFAIFPWKTDTPSGIFAGGITRDGVIQQDAWIWKLEKTSSKEPVISFTRFQVGPRLCQAPSYLARFGAVAVNHCNRVWLIGGILNSSVLKQSEICVVDEELTISWATVDFGTNVPRPLLVGISAISANEQLVIMGGSAVCFSFGSYWNKGCYTLQRTDYEGSEVRTWKYLHTKEPAKSKAALNSLSEGLPNSKSLFSIHRIKIDSAVDLWKIISAGQPAILEGLDLGPCTTEWTTEYLKACVGVEREIIVHEASEEHMNFTSKNFSYVTKKFGQFMDEVDGGAKLYLRSLSAEKPSEIPADIAKDFPSLAGGFRLPPELSYITKNVHSSPLRISGPVIMWLHYDVMANVLCQIRGTKRLLLFPPTDVKLFDFEPGASSSSINVFDKLKDPTLACAHTHEAVLQPGDVLFIPSLWLHTTAPTSGSSISVNVFFRNMQSGYAAGKDVYGNRDLQAYEKGRQDISKVIRSFNNLPVDARGFYLQRLADEFGRSAC